MKQESAKVLSVFSDDELLSISTMTQCPLPSMLNQPHPRLDREAESSRETYPLQLFLPGYDGYIS
ncbi:hypothetical protein NQZ68_040142 [Dissostichus eleginoides]|nr:hypothetical protein NQZ68_040142 [Dissostichus eleginoides]